MWKCPNCNTENEDFADIIDNDYDDNIKLYIDKAIGECPKCGKRFLIDIFYKYSHCKYEEIED